MSSVKSSTACLRIYSDAAVWIALSKDYRVNLLCGLFMNETNDGISLSSQTLAVLAERGIGLWFDIYLPIQDDAVVSSPVVSQ